MRRNKIIMFICLLFVILIGILYTYRYTISSNYIAYKVSQLNVVRTYTSGPIDLTIVGADWQYKDTKNSVIELNGYSNNNMKKVAVQYYCPFWCSISSVGIYEKDQRTLIYGENSSKDWIDYYNGSIGP